MRILQVAPRYAPAWAFGGGVRMTYELARVWVQRGHDVTVFASDQETTARRFDELNAIIDGIRIRRFRNPSHVLATRFPPVFFRPAGLAAALRAARADFDVVHVAESRGPHNRWVARELAPHVPVAWSAYGGLAEGEGSRRLYRRLHDAAFQTSSIVRRASALIAQTTHEAETYQRFGADAARIYQIPLAVNWADFATLPARGSFRRRLGLTDQERLVLFLGRIHRTKGLHVLIQAFAAISRQSPHARLAVVGWDHGYLETARRLGAELGLGERVLFPGPLYGIERFAAYVDADVFALTPDVYEETSLSALEACASGTSCVITQQCEIPGLDAADAGRTVDFGVDSVARGLAEALEDGVGRRRGANARQLVREHFAIDTVARRHEVLFEALAARRRQTVGAA